MEDQYYKSEDKDGLSKGDIRSAILSLVILSICMVVSILALIFVGDGGYVMALIILIFGDIFHLYPAFKYGSRNKYTWLFIALYHIVISIALVILSFNIPDGYAILFVIPLFLAALSGCFAYAALTDFFEFDRRQAEDLEYEKKEAERRRKEAERMAGLEKSLGPLTKSIIVRDDTIEGKVLAFDQYKHLLVLGKIFPYFDLLDFKVYDKKIVVRGSTYTTTNIDKVDMFGKMLLGTMALGRKGIFLGAAAAKRKKEVIHEPDSECHSYKITIRIKDYWEKKVETIIVYTSYSEVCKEICTVLNEARKHKLNDALKSYAIEHGSFPFDSL